MRLLLFFVLVPVLVQVVTAFSFFEEIDTYGLEKYQDMFDSLAFLADETITKRDEVSTLEGVFTAVGNSGIIQDLLYSIAQDDNQINALINVTTDLVKGGSVSVGGLNITINSSELISTVLSSGIIQGTAGRLLFNSTRLDILTNFTCNLLASQVYIPKILVNLGNGDDLTLQMLADTVKYTPNLNPKFNTSLQDNGQSKQAVLAARENTFAETVPEIEDDIFARANEGSALLFFSNIIQTALSGGLLNATLSNILVALNRSDIVPPLAIDLLQNDTIKSMVPKLISGLYKNGVFDDLPLSSLFNHAKKTDLLSDALQLLLTNPTWEPPIGYLLNKCDAMGGYHDIQIALYGVKK